MRRPLHPLLRSLRAAALATLAVAPPATAQLSPPMSRFEGPSLVYQAGDRHWPAGVGGPAVDFGKIVDADLDGDLLRDAVVLDGGVPVFAAGPAVFTSFTDLVDGGYTVRDLDRLPRAGPGGGDGLVVLDAAGLSSIAFDGSGFAVTPIAVTGAWPQATRVVAVDLGTAAMVLGLGADRRTVVSVVRVAGGVWARGPTFGATADVIDLAAADVDADGQLEIVLATADALEPFDLRGSPRTPFPAAGTTLAIAVLPGAAAAGDRIAWVTADAGGWKQLAVVGPSGVEPPQTLAFPLDESQQPIDFAFTGIRAGDVDRDGDRDLLIGQKTALYAIVLLDVGSETTGSPAFAPELPQAVKLLPLAADPHVPVPGNDCVPSCADYDGDGFADVLSARDDAQLLNLQQGVDLFGLAFLGDPGISAEDIVYHDQDFDPDPNDGALHLVMTLPEAYREAFDYLEVTVWRQDQPYALVESDARAHAFYRIVKGTGGPVEEHQWLTVDDTALFPPGPAWPHADHFYVVFRFVDLAGGQVGAITDASPSFAFGMTLQTATGTTGWEDYLLGLPDAGGSGSLNSGEGPPAPGGPPPTGGGRTLVGAVVVQRVLPPMSIILPPDKGAPAPEVRPMSTWDPLSYW